MIVGPAVGDKEPAQAEHAQADDREAHHEPAREGDVERRRQTRPRGLRRADVGLRRDGHPDEPGERRAQRADDERDGDERRRGRRREVGDGQKRRHGDDEHGQHAVLAAQERARAFGDVGGDLLHLGRARVLLRDPARADEGVAEREHARDGDEQGERRRIHQRAEGG